MSKILQHRLFAPIFLLAACAASFLLWLPSVSYPIVSDTTLYALLGESVWKHGTYALLGEAHGKHLPLHAILSYPLVWSFGYSLGMKLSTLFAGFAVLIALFTLLRRVWSKEVAVWTVIAVVFHHGFISMTTLGSADLLLTFLFLLILHFYLNAGTPLRPAMGGATEGQGNPRWYIPMGVTLGLACLTRYNAVPLFIFLPFYTLWKRPKHLFSPWFLGSMILGGGIYMLWFVRSYLVFGQLSNDYTEEFGVKARGPVAQFFVNIKYYANPLRNIMPILLISSLYGMYRFGKAQIFLLTAMLAILSLFAVWPVLNIRYAVPGYVLLLAFAVAGIADAADRLGRWKIPFLTFLLLGITVSHGLALCLYQYGSCNALWDRTIGHIPKNLGLASEGYESFDQARDYIDSHAEKNAEVVVLGEWNEAAWKTGVFRKDLRVVMDEPSSCPAYFVTQEPKEGDEIVFQTKDQPVVSVVGLCKK